MKLYLLTKGQYSDCKAVGIFSTEDKARAAMRLFVKWDRANEPIEFELDSLVTAIPDNHYIWEVTFENPMTRGDVLFCEQADIDEYNQYKNTNGFYFVTAPDQDTAIKIANERRVQLVASGYYDPTR